MKRLGGLWSKTGKKDGKKYLEGTLTVKVLVFKSDKKKSEKHPDFIVYLKDDLPKIAFEDAKVTQEDFL